MLHLHTLWFVVIVFFWTGFYVLEGFDFGVGMLHVVVGHNEEERAEALESIGPFWDGNEVWLIVAGAATFAAFPGWYATMFSSLYLALLLILAGLMARGVALEFQSKLDDPRWRRAWTAATVVGSALVPLLLGVGLGDLLAGLPVNQNHEFTGNFFDLLTPYGLWTGVTFLLLSLLHGATFLIMKTTGEVQQRSAAVARVLVWVAAVAMLAFVIWTRAIAGPHFPSPLIALAAIAVLAAPYLISTQHAGWAFATSAAGMATAVVSIFVALYPNVLVSSTNAAYNLTVSNSSSAKYALTVMTVVAVVFLPLVLLYQGWSYHVFRARVGLGKTPTNPQPPTADGLKTEPTG